MTESIFTSYPVEVCRCLYSDFYKYGFSEQHYFKTICKGAMCYLLFIGDEVVAFASLLAMPRKGRTDCVIFHRIVVSQRWRNRGVGGFLTLFLCGIYKSIGKEVYMKVQSKTMGKWMEREPQLWCPTAMNRVARKFTTKDRKRNKARYRKAAFSHRYVGNVIVGYEQIANPMSVMRDNNDLYKRISIDVCLIMGSLWGIDSDIIKDFNSFPVEMTLEKYDDKFEYFTHTQLEPTCEIAFRLPDDYRELRLKNMTMAALTYRRRVAYLNAIIRRLIKRNISINHLIYCLMKDNITYNFGLSIIEVFGICRKAMTTDIIQYEGIGTFAIKPTYKINKEVASCKGITVGQARNIARGERTSEIIRSLYDDEKTDEENIRYFTEAGLSISVRTLKRWRKTNGYMKYNRQK